MRIVYTPHARTVLAERAIQESWIEAALASPDWVEPDPADASVERRFRAIPEMAGRVLRVACSGDAGEVRVITGILRPESETQAMTLRLTFDAATNAAYLRFSTASVHDSEEVAEGVVIDYDVEGRMVGIEVLDARKHLPADALAAAE